MTTFGKGEGNVSMILYLTSEMYVHVERGDVVPVARGAMHGEGIDEAVEFTGTTSSCTGTTSSESTLSGSDEHCKELTRKADDLREAAAHSMTEVIDISVNN